MTEEIRFFPSDDTVSNLHDYVYGNIESRFNSIDEVVEELESLISSTKGFDSWTSGQIFFQNAKGDI